MTLPLSNESNIISFFKQYFIDPITNKTGYNPVNTIVYGVLLVLGAYFLFRFFKKLGYAVDARFFKASVPFILLVSVWRALTDFGIYAYGFFTTTPGLYVPVLFIFFPLVILAKKIEDWKGWRYEYIYSGVSAGLLASQLIILFIALSTSSQSTAVFAVFFFTLMSWMPFFILYRIDKHFHVSNKELDRFSLALSRFVKPLRDKFNLWMFLAQFFDASSTFVSLTYYGYSEQHVAPSFIMATFGNWAFYAWKVIILCIVIYVLDYVIKDNKNKELTNFIKMVFITFGIATGTRDMLRLAMGV